MPARKDLLIDYMAYMGSDLVIGQNGLNYDKIVLLIALCIIITIF